MKTILVLGSGFTAKPLVDYLLDQGRYKLIVTGITAAEAQRITERRLYTEAAALDIRDEDALGRFIDRADLVISLVPYEFHAQVAKCCISAATGMITTSYAKEEIQALDGEAKRAHTLILKEIGLDPGIDHMSAMQIIHEIEEKGGKVLEFRSHCGGIPAPDADTNPLHYKFSWSPKGVLIAAAGDGRYLEQGREIAVAGKNIDRHASRLEVEGMQLESYPNRDALPYLGAYGLPDAHTLLRATLRYPGWCALMAAANRIGLLSEQPLAASDAPSHRVFMSRVMDIPETDDPADLTLEKLGLTRDSDVFRQFEWLDLFSSQVRLPAAASCTPIDFLTAVMLERMKYGPEERDMVVLVHEFLAELPEGLRRRTATLVEYGVAGGYSAMAKTVAFPAAVAAHLILQDRIQLEGVHIPVLPEIYVPVQAELERLGLRFRENTEAVS